MWIKRHLLSRHGLCCPGFYSLLSDPESNRVSLSWRGVGVDGAFWLVASHAVGVHVGDWSGFLKVVKKEEGDFYSSRPPGRRLELTSEFYLFICFLFEQLKWSKMKLLDQPTGRGTSTTRSKTVRTAAFNVSTASSHLVSLQTPNFIHWATVRHIFLVTSWTRLHQFVSLF